MIEKHWLKALGVLILLAWGALLLVKRVIFDEITLRYVSLVIIGILAAIAIPNFMTYQAKARQSEAKVGLGGIFTTATSFFAENGTFSVSSAAALGYSPAGSPKYSFSYAGSTINNGATASVCGGNTTVVASTATDTGFTAGAIGNIDGDTTCDEWIINDIRILSNAKNDVSN